MRRWRPGDPKILQLSGRTTLRIAATLVSGLLCTVAHAQCPTGWLQFEEAKGDGNVIITAFNRSPVPLTFTMEIEKQRLSASRQSTFTDSLQPQEARQVVTLTRTSPDQVGYYSYNTDCTIGNKDADHDDYMIYLMPYEKGKSYKVLQGYGSRFSHTGLEQYAVDFYMKEGTPVHAARAGVVARIEESNSIGCWQDGCGRYANYIVILHDDETTGEYYHLQKDGVLVEPGEVVKAGQMIGLSGNTGHTTMPHLHFGVYRADAWGREQSIPVRFLTEHGVIEEPRRGGRYLATAAQSVGGSDEPKNMLNNQGLN